MPEDVTGYSHNEMIDTILEFIQRSEFRFENNGPEDNVCYDCGWSANRDKKHHSDPLSHKEGCPIPRLKEFLTSLKKDT